MVRFLCVMLSEHVGFIFGLFLDLKFNVHGQHSYLKPINMCFFIVTTIGEKCKNYMYVGIYQGEISFMFV